MLNKKDRVEGQVRDQLRDELGISFCYGIWGNKVTQGQVSNNISCVVKREVDTRLLNHIILEAMRNA